MKHKAGYFLVAAILIFASCKKWKDTPGATSPLLNRPYCNDPTAVNYNWDFPGKPDNSVCFYPTDVFKGNFIYTDSIYDGSQKFIREQVLNLTVSTSSRYKMTVSGFCGTGSISFTATRQLRADVDTVVGYGQLLCRPKDTITGNIDRTDVTGPVIFDLTVNTDTGLTYHRGSAIRQ